jgi:hypothetical protein
VQPTVMSYIKSECLRVKEAGSREKKQATDPVLKEVTLKLFFNLRISQW